MKRELALNRSYIAPKPLVVDATSDVGRYGTPSIVSAETGITGCLRIADNTIKNWARICAHETELPEVAKRCERKLKIDKSGPEMEDKLQERTWNNVQEIHYHQAQ